MEKVNLNFSGKDNIIKSICWIFSVLGWLMYLICGWISIKWLAPDYYDYHRNDDYRDIGSYIPMYRYDYPYYGYTYGQGIVMTIIRRSIISYQIRGSVYKNALIYPLQLQTSVIYIIVILTMVFALFAFIVYMIKSTCKKEGGVFDGMMGDWTRLHCIPLFIAAGLFLIGICLREKIYSGDHSYENWFDDWKSGNIAGTVLVILGLAALIFIYIKTDLPDDWLTASIKKGAYSTLIALEWYYFCYIICNLCLIDRRNDFRKNGVLGKRYAKFMDDVSACGIAMPIIEGVGALVFAFFFKDVVIAFMNVLIFAGAMGYYFSIDKDFRKEKQDNVLENFLSNFGITLERGGHGVAEGIIDLVFLVLSIVVIVLLIILKKKECLK